ncbi:MAG: hypothetical protein HC906_09185 [Bacteroidales bacterium]|nr:hypothetical protein [Bacteroidales bacterium]
MYGFFKNGKTVPFNELPLQRTLRRETFSDLELKITNNHTGKAWYSNFSGSPVLDEQGNFIFQCLP